MFNRKKESKTPLSVIGFLQASGLLTYCSLVALVFWQGNKWFGKMPNFGGPLLMLTILVVSALVCGLLALGYPIILFWQENRKTDAVKLVASTAIWLASFVLVFVFLMTLS